MKPHNVLFEVGGQSLGQSWFFSHADRVASFPFLIPSTGSFERRMIKELFSFNPFPSKGCVILPHLPKAREPKSTQSNTTSNFNQYIRNYSFIQETIVRNFVPKIINFPLLPKIFSFMHAFSKYQELKLSE